MLTVQQIRGGSGPENINICVTVLDVSKTCDKDQYGKKRFNAIFADTTGAISCNISGDRDFHKFITGLGVNLYNVLNKTSYIVVTSKSDVGMCPGMEIPEDIIKNAPKLPGSLVCNIKTALDSPEKTMLSVKGKVTKVCSASDKTVNNKRVDFQDIVLKDSSGTIKVALWDNLVGTISKGQTVEIQKCRIKLFKNEKKLSTTDSSTAEPFITTDELYEVSSDEEEDNTDEMAIASMSSSTIEAIIDADPYLSCPQNSCNNVKLTTEEDDDGILKMRCKVCRGLYRASHCNKYVRVVAMMKCGDERKKIVMFSPHLNKMFQARGLDDSIVEWDSTELLKRLMHLLPMEIKYKMANSSNTIRDIICKRAATD